MAVTLDVGFAVDEKGLLQVIDKAAAHWQQAFSQVGVGVESNVAKAAQSAIDASGKIAREQVADTQKVVQAQQAALNSHVASVKSAEDLLTQIAATNATKRTALAGKEFREVETQLQLLRVKRQDIESAITASTDKELTKRLQAQKKEVAEELKLVRDEYAKRDEVIHGGEGAKNGALGLMRELGGDSISKLTSGLGPLQGIMSGIGGAGLGMAGGVAAAGAALTGLFEKGMASAERAEQMKIGFMSAGQSAEQAEKSMKLLRESSKEVSHELVINKTDLENATAAYLKLGGSTKDIGAKQQDIAALSVKAGIDMESAGKLLAKATDPENQKNLARYGINLAGVTDEAERSRIIHEKLAGTLAGMKGAADSPLGGMKRLQQSFSEITEAIGTLVFEAVSPLISILGAVAKVIQDYVVPVVKTAISVALFPLKTAIELVMAIVSGAIQTFVAIAAWIGKVTGITALLGAAWDAITSTVKSVVEWFNKAKDTVSNLGSSLTKLLGISSESEQKAGELAEARAKEKDAADAVRKSTDDYTESLIKNQQESTASAKQAQDNSIAAIVDIQTRMKSATGEERAQLELRLQQWTEYGKKNAGIQDAQEAARHAAALAIGAAKDAPPKEAKSAVSKVDKADKDAYELEKKAEDVRFANDKLILERQLASKLITQEQFSAKIEAVETLHVDKLNEIASRHRAGHEADAQAAEDAMLKLKIAANAKQAKAEEAAQKDALKKSLELLDESTVAALQKKQELLASGVISERAFAEEEYKIQRRAIEDRITLEEGAGNAVAEIRKQLLALDSKHRIDSIKNAKSDVAEQKKALDELKAKQMDTLKTFGAPAITAWHNLTTAATAGIHKMTAGLREMGGVGGGVLADLMDGVVQLGVTFVEQQLASLAESLVTTATITTAQTTSMGIITAAAAPAAAAVSTATAGGAAVAGGSSLLAMIGSVFAALGLADGGFVGGIGGERDDKNPRLLSRNEFVVNSKAASKWAPVLYAMNSGQDISFGNRGGGTFMLDESQVRRLEKKTVLSSQRMLLDNQKAQQQRARTRI